MIWYWLAWWFSGLALVILARWWNGEDLPLVDAVTFTFGTAFMGPTLVLLYWFSRWRDTAPRRTPVILLRGRER